MPAALANSAGQEGREGCQLSKKGGDETRRKGGKWPHVCR